MTKIIKSGTKEAKEYLKEQEERLNHHLSYKADIPYLFAFDIVPKERYIRFTFDGHTLTIYSDTNKLSFKIFFVDTRNNICLHYDITNDPDALNADRFINIIIKELTRTQGGCSLEIEDTNPVTNTTPESVNYNFTHEKLRNSLIVLLYDIDSSHRDINHNIKRWLEELPDPKSDSDDTVNNQGAFLAFRNAYINIFDQKKSLDK